MSALPTWLLRLIFALIVLVPATVTAKTFEVLHEFAGGFGGAKSVIWDDPGPLTIGPTGLIYGIDPELSGTKDVCFGYVYSLDPISRKLKILHKFCATDAPYGAEPVGGLTFGDDGMIYGLTFAFSTTGFPAIYRLNPVTGAVIYLATLNIEGAPSGKMTFAKGFLYGSLYYLQGVVFKFDIAKRAFSRLHTFQGRTSQVLFRDGALYGTTYSSSGRDTVYKLDISTKRLTTLYSFAVDSALPDPYPTGGVIFKEGALYGTTQYTSIAGAAGYGTIFKIDIFTGKKTTLHVFDQRDGSMPSYPLVSGPGSDLFGVTMTNIFKFDLSANKITVLYRPNPRGQASPPSSDLAISKSGVLYGTAGPGVYGAGESLNEAIYRLTP